MVPVHFSSFESSNNWTTDGHEPSALSSPPTILLYSQFHSGATSVFHTAQNHLLRLLGERIEFRHSDLSSRRFRCIAGLLIHIPRSSTGNLPNCSNMVHQ